MPKRDIARELYEAYKVLFTAYVRRGALALAASLVIGYSILVWKPEIASIQYVHLGFAVIIAGAAIAFSETVLGRSEEE